MMLDRQEIDRYDRQLKLTGVGEAGQIKLKEASVLVIGAGGLGCPALQYLAAAGVGHIGIMDFDLVSESNLQRQVLFTVEHIGSNKAEIARKRLSQLNPLIRIESIPEKLEPLNARQIIASYDVILDCSDNFETRYLVNDACVILDRPFIYGAIHKYEGQLSVFNYQNGPSYRCLFPEPPQAGVHDCDTLGVLGVLPGMIGVQQANEAIKIILGIGKVLSGKLLLYDSLSSEYTSIEIERNEELVQQVILEQDSLEKRDYHVFCRREENDMNEINLEEFVLRLEDESTQILDVREAWEQPKIEKDFVMNIPVRLLETSLDQIPRTGELIVICQHGVRSKAVVEFLQSRHNFPNLINLREGVSTYVK